MYVKKETSRSDNRERPKFYSRIDQGDRVAIGRRSGRRYDRKITGPRGNHYFENGRLADVALTLFGTAA
jgi:hypothetical protein